MNLDEAKTAILAMKQERELNRGHCPRCGFEQGHAPNCAWAGRYEELSKIVLAVEPMQGPNLKWGDPCGTYEIEIVPGGAVMFYRSMQRNGGLLEIKIPFTTTALAEMQALLNMIEFPFKVEVPNGRISGSC